MNTNLVQQQRSLAMLNSNSGEAQQKTRRRQQQNNKKHKAISRNGREQISGKKGRKKTAKGKIFALVELGAKGVANMYIKIQYKYNTRKIQCQGAKAKAPLRLPKKKN